MWSLPSLLRVPDVKHSISLGPVTARVSDFATLAGSLNPCVAVRTIHQPQDLQEPPHLQQET